MKSWFLLLLLICQPCIAQECGGLLVEGPVELGASRVVKWWLGPGTMQGLTRQEFEAKVIQGVRELDEVCGLDFVRVADERKAKVRITLKPDLGGPLGLAWSSGRIEFQTTRKINNIKTRRIVESLTCHEIGHVFGMRHGDVRQCVMHPYLGQHWCPGEVERLQSLWGLPELNDKPFYPTLRAEIGRELRRQIDLRDKARAAWIEARNKREAFKAKQQWANARAIDPTVKRRHAAYVSREKLVVEWNQKWWAENRRWNNSKVKGFRKAG